MPLALPLASLVFLGAFIPLVGAVVASTDAAAVFWNRRHEPWAIAQDKAIAKAAAADDTEAVNKAFAEQNKAFAERDKAAKELGTEVCGQKADIKVEPSGTEPPADLDYAEPKNTIEEAATDYLKGFKSGNCSEINSNRHSDAGQLQHHQAGEQRQDGDGLDDVGESGTDGGVEDVLDRNRTVHDRRQVLDRQQQQPEHDQADDVGRQVGQHRGQGCFLGGVLGLLRGIAGGVERGDQVGGQDHREQERGEPVPLGRGAP